MPANILLPDCKSCQSCVFVWVWICLCLQLNQALAGKFNAHVHVEYEWCLQHEDLDESDEDLDEKVRQISISRYASLNWGREEESYEENNEDTLWWKGELSESLGNDETKNIKHCLVSLKTLFIQNKRLNLLFLLIFQSKAMFGI